MDTVKMRNHILEAHHHEDNTHELARLLQGRLHQLHKTVNLSASEPQHQLLHFVSTFVKRTPELIDTLQEIAIRIKNEGIIETLTGVCMDYFFWPPPLLAGRHGMNGVMGKAYLCHRLIEEFNDCHQVFCNYPLLPLDLTCSNLIVHQLIGEPAANLLDDFVHNTTAELCERCNLNSYSAPAPTDRDYLLEVCRRRSLLDDLSQAAIINNGFPRCVIH